MKPKKVQKVSFPFGHKWIPKSPENAQSRSSGFPVEGEQVPDVCFLSSIHDKSGWLGYSASFELSFLGAGQGRGQLCWGPARETDLAPHRAQLATPSSQPTRSTSEDGSIAFGVCPAVGGLFLQGEVPLKLDAHAWRVLPCATDVLQFISKQLLFPSSVCFSFFFFFK